MKTNTTEAPAAVSQPGNLSVRQLARSLMQTPAAGNKPETGNSEADTATSREESSSHEGESNEENPNAGNETESLEQKPTEGTETETAAEHTDATAETESTEATEAENAEGDLATEGTESTETPKAGLPEELKDAIAIAKGDGKKGVAQLLERVRKLVDVRDTERNARLAADEQNAQLRKELQDARSQKPEARGQGNGMVHPAVAAVSEELGNVDHWLGWCEEHAEGGEIPNGDKGTAELSADQVKALRTRLERERTEVVARKVQTEREVRAEYDRQYAQHHSTAVTHYPWLKNANAPEAQEMQAVLKAFPQVKMAPDHELAIADMIAGKALRLAKAKANGNGVPVRKPIQREPAKVLAEAPATSAARKSPEKAKKDEADSQFRKTGSMKDLAKSFAAGRKAIRTGG